MFLRYNDSCWDRVAGGHAPQNGWPCKLVRSTGFPYRIFILTVLYGFGPYRTVTVPYMRSENVDTAYKHSTGTDTVACIYNVDGNCKGMLTPERPNILRKAFDRAKRSALHDHVQPSAPISFSSALVGLIARKDISASKHTNKIFTLRTDIPLPHHHRLSKVGPGH